MPLDLKIGGMRKLNQREIVLVTLAAIIGIIAVIYFFRGEGSIGFTGPESRFTPEQARAKVVSQLRVPPVDLELLDEPTDAFVNTRNLFEYGRAKRSPRGGDGRSPDLPGDRGRTPGLPGSGGEGTGEKEPEEKEPEAGTVALPDPPDMNLKFVGFIGPPENKTVFLTDEEAEENYIGGVGEAIAGQFRILEIGYEYVEIGYTDPIFEGQSKRVILAEWSEEEDE